MGQEHNINDKQRHSAIIEPSPLRYDYEGVRRLSVIDTSYPVSEKPRNNFDEMTGTLEDLDTGERTTLRRPGATKGTVSYVDYRDSGRRGIDIAFTQVHPEHRGKGLAREAISRLYESNPGRKIHWGKLMEPEMGTLYRSFQDSHPEQTGSAKYYYRT